MNILITGSSGFCGSFLKNHLQKNESYNIFSLSRKQENGQHFVFDLQNPIPSTLITEKIDCIIHCASIVNEKNSDYSILNNNLRIAYNIQNFVRQKIPKFLINLSSVSVYGSPDSLNVDESFIQKPVSTYGISKFLIEDLFNAMIPLDTHLVNLRLGYVIGPKLPSKYVLSRFQNLLKNNEKISLINPDTTKFSFIDLSDIAKTCEMIINKNLSGNYNLVGDKACTLREVFNLLKNFYPKYDQIVTENEDSDIKFSTTFSNKKIKQFDITFKNYHKSFKEIFSSD